MPNLLVTNGATTNAGSGGTAVLNLPSGATVGQDWYYALFASRGTAATSHTAPSGFTQQLALTSGSNLQVSLWRKLCASGDPGASATWTVVGAAPVTGLIVFTAQGANLSEPESVAVPTPTITTNSNDIPMAGVTPQDNDCLLIGCAIGAADLSASDATPPAGMTQNAELFAGAANGSHRLLHVCSEELSGGSGTPIASRSATTNATGGAIMDSQGFMFVLKSAGSTETMRPNAALVLTNLTGAYTDIDDDPDAPDAAWLTNP